MKKLIISVLIIVSAINTSYSQCPATLTDIDGNIYNVVQIGNQCWTKENLTTTRYKSGILIPTGLSDANWSNTFLGAYSIYNNNLNNNTVYGKLYNWYAVADPNGLCPTGWHVPSNSEWHKLVYFLDTNSDTLTNSAGWTV